MIHGMRKNLNSTKNNVHTVLRDNKGVSAMYTLDKLCIKTLETSRLPYSIPYCREASK